MKQFLAHCALAASLVVAGCGGGESGGKNLADRTIPDLAAAAPPAALAPQSAMLPMAATSTTKELLVNGGFEGGPAGWTASPDVLWSSADAHAGASFAWLGGYDNAVDRLSQTVTLPSSAVSITLRFWLLIATSETLPGAWDGMQLAVNDTSGNNLAILKLYTNQDATGGWVQSDAFDLTRFAGQTVELRFTAVTDNSAQSSFLVDDVSLTAAMPADPGVTLAGTRSNWDIEASGNEYIVTPTNTGGTRVVLQHYQPGQRLNFSDMTVALDTLGVPSQVYRLYQAAFNRKPDAGGLGYQISAIEDTGLSLLQVAQNFINSPEFATRYGSLSDTQFVTQLYQNVLNRAPDAGGLAYHLARLASGVPRSAVLIGFSESPENQTAVAPAIANGIPYIPLNRSTTPTGTICYAPQVLRNGVCVTVPPVPTCVAPAVLTNGQCAVPTATCTPPKVLQAGLCVTVQTTCTAPQVLQDGLCVTPPPAPPPAPTCTGGQVLQNNICVTPPPVTCPTTQVLVGNTCVNRTSVPPLNGNVVLEEFVFGHYVYGQTWTYNFAWTVGRDVPSFYPRLTSNLSETVTFDVCFGEHPQNSCPRVRDVPPKTTFTAGNDQPYASGIVKVYATRQLSVDPTQTRILVATFDAKDWGWVPVVPIIDPCFINGSIRNPNCHGLGSVPTPDPTVTPPPGAPAPSSGSGSGSGSSGNAMSCVTATTSGNTVTLHNNCGRKIFFMWCGNQQFTNATCNSTPAYYTHDTNSDPSDYSATTDITLKDGAVGTLKYGACYGQTSWGRTAWTAYSDGSYVCTGQ